MSARRRAVASLLVIVVLLLVGAAVWVAVDEDGAGAVPPDAVPGASSADAAPHTTTTATSAAPRRPRAKAAEAAPAANAAQDTAALEKALANSVETFPFRLRMLADEDDAPIAGAVVRGAESNSFVKRKPGPDVSEWRVWAAERAEVGVKVDPERLATTDAEGRCSLTVPDGWPVEIRADGRWSERVHTRSTERGETIVWLRRTGRIRGRVEEPDGTPVPNAKVALSPSSAPRGLSSSAAGVVAENFGFTDVEGRFTYDAPCGAGIHVAVFRPGADSVACLMFVRLTARRPEQDLQLVLRGKARLRIDVVRPDGTPARGATVEILDAALLRRIAHGRAEDGRFEQDVEGGALTLNAAFDASPLEYTRDVVVGVADGERVERTLQLVSSVAIAGRVVDGQGRGIDGARIEWSEAPGTLRATARPIGMRNDPMMAPVPEPVVTDAEGRFSLAGLRAGRHVGRLIAPGALPRRVEFTAPAVDLEFVVAASARVRWTLVADGGAAVPGEVQFRWVPGGDEKFAVASRLVGDGGAFSMSVPPGPGRLRVQEADGTLLVERDLDLVPATTTDLGALAVAASRTIRWRNVWLKDIGHPQVWAMIRADGARRDFGRLRVTAEGELQVQVREAANERLLVMFESGTAAVSDVLPPRGDLDLGTLTPQPLGRLRGVVLRQTGSMPGGPATWSAVPGIATEPRPVAVDGAFEGMLPAGRVRILIRSEHFGACEQDVEILPGRTTEATFRLNQ